MTSNLHCSECFFIKFVSGLISRGNEYRCQDAIESHRGAFNEITGFSQRISTIEKKKGGNEISSMGCGYRVERGLWLSRGREEERGETRVISDLRCQITNLFPTLVLIIKLKLLLHIDSSGCALVLSPIKREKRRDYMKPSGAFYGSCETVKPCHGLQSNKTSSLCLCVCVCALLLMWAPMLS